MHFGNYRQILTTTSDIHHKKTSQQSTRFYKNFIRPVCVSGLSTSMQLTEPQHVIGLISIIYPGLWQRLNRQLWAAGTFQLLPENYLAVKLPGNFGEKASNVIIQRYVYIQPTISRGLTTIIYQSTSLGDRKKTKTGAMTFTALWLTVKQEHCVPACCVAFYTTRLQMCFIFSFQMFWL